MTDAMKLLRLSAQRLGDAHGLAERLQVRIAEAELELETATNLLHGTVPPRDILSRAKRRRR